MHALCLGADIHGGVLRSARESDSPLFVHVRANLGWLCPYFKRADLRGVNAERANFGGANLEGANEIHIPPR